MKRQFRNFFYMAPPFSGFMGHYYNYAYGLYLACRRQGIAFQALGSSRIEVHGGFPSDLPFRGIYPKAEPIRVGRFRMRRMEKLGHFLRSCRAHCSTARMPGFGRNAVCLVEEPHVYNVPALRFWLQRLRREGCPMLGFMFRYGLLSADGAYWLPILASHEPVLRLLEKEGKRLPVMLFTDSHLVENHLKKLTTLPIKVLPTHFENAGEAEISGLPKNGRILHFYVPGIVAVTKGIPLLVEALARLKGDPAMEWMHFSIPFYPQPKKGSVIMKSLELLESFELPNVEILRQGLNRQEYYRRLLGADVVLSPYDPDRYQSTSGPFAEALALGKPVVTSEKTWMSGILDRGYGAGITFPFGDSVRLSEALCRMVAEYGKLSVKAQSSRDAWIGINGSDAILKRLLEAA